MSKFLRILLVEDSEDDAKLLIHTLARGGVAAEVTRVESPEGLVEALQLEWDAVISDFRLIGFSGLDALKLCRHRQPELPFILMSGTIGEQTAVDAVKAGANDYVMKESLPRIITALQRSIEEARTRSELKKTELKLVESERRFHAFMDAGPLIASIKDKSGNYLYKNRGCEQELLLAAPNMIEEPDILSRSQQKSDWDVLQDGIVDETIDEHRDLDGSVHFRKRIRFPFLGGEGNILLGSFSTDVTKEKLAEDRVRQLAYLDPLTNLPNRRLMSDRLSRALARSVRSKSHGALLFIDLDNFKTLNDTRGHDVGDQLLRDVGNRLLQCVRENDTVSRSGGDEFVVILESLGSHVIQAAATAEVIAKKILAAMQDPFLLAGQDHAISLSIGIALFFDNHLQADELMKRADLAMYSVKSTGRNGMMFFDPGMQTKLKQRLELEEKIISGMQQHQFELYYQPQVDQYGKMTGVEALLRLQTIDGIIMPSVFIPLAEETDLIVELGYTVFELACKQLALWAKQPNMAELSISVNVSPRQFRHGLFVQQVIELAQLHQINPRLLTLEITESLLFEEIDQVIEKMHTLRQHGFQFSLDDFGTGYSSLYYLKLLPLHEIKIDRSFVHELPDDGNSATIVRAIIAMCHSLGVSAIAEGVETGVQQDFLNKHGCDRYQGYLYGEPVPAQALLH